LAQLVWPICTLGGLAIALQSAMVCAESVFALFDEVPEVIERADARPLGRAQGVIAFRDVTFSFDGANLVLRGISVEISPGTRLGISGSTGSGKTTLVSLLTRFYDPGSGQILLD